MPKFRKKPIVIEAQRFEPTPDGAVPIAFLAFLGDAGRVGTDALGPRVLIDTLEGQMRGDPGDWIIKGVKGELYPCKVDVFEASYEPAEI